MFYKAGIATNTVEVEDVGPEAFHLFLHDVYGPSRPVDTESVPEFVTLAELHSLARRFGADAALLGGAAARMEALGGHEGVYAALAGMEEAAARHGVEELRGPLAAREEAVEGRGRGGGRRP